MNAAGTPRSPGRDLGLAQEATDLVPGDLRSIGVFGDGLLAGARGLAGAATTLADATRAVSWWGDAFARFSRHRAMVIDCTDTWSAAADQVRVALTDHQGVVAEAREQAAEALELWAQARRQAGDAGAWATPATLQAANAEAVRAEHTQAVALTAQRARVLLEHAQNTLAASGDAAAEVVVQASAMIRATRLPPLPGTLTDLPSPPDWSTAVATVPDVLAEWAGATVTVGPPRDGVYDTLARIAARVLGDSTLWPVLYRLNLGQPVGPGAILTDPTMLEPGWTLRLPDTTTPATYSGTDPEHESTHHAAFGTGGHRIRTGHTQTGDSGGDVTSPSGAAAAPHPPAPGPPDTQPLAPGPHAAVQPDPPTSQPAPTHTPATTPAQPGTAQANPPVTDTAEHSVDVGGGLILAGGVAAALAGIVIAASATRRRAYRPGGHAAELAEQPATDQHTVPDTVPPVARRLAAHLPPPPRPTPPVPPTPFPAAMPGHVRPGSLPVPFAHRDGQAVLIDIAATFGLGLVGPGALDAARALLLSTVATHPHATAILSDNDRHRLLRHRLVASPTRPATARVDGGRVTVTARAAGVLDRVEAEIVTRTRLLTDSRGQLTLPPLLVIMTVQSDRRRLQAVADLGAGLGITVVVLGPWPAGITTVIAADGRLTDARGLRVREWRLPGLSVFRAPARDTAELLALLSATPADGTAGIDATGGHRTPAQPFTHRGVDNSVDNRESDRQTTRITPPTSTAAAAAAETGAGTDQPHRDHADAPAPSHDAPASPVVIDDGASIVPSPGQIARRLAATDTGPNTALADGPGRTSTADSDDAAPTPSSAGPDTSSRTAPSARPHPHPATAPPPPQPSAAPAGAQVTVLVLGAIRLFHTAPADASSTVPGPGQEITSAIGPRLRELIALIAVHPDGIRRDEIVDHLWQDTNPRRPRHPLNTALARLRRALTQATNEMVTDLVVHDDQRLWLNPDLVSVDVWEFQRAWADARTATDPAARGVAYRRMVEVYGGSLAEGLDADWVVAPRQSLHRAATDAVSGLARLLIATDPRQTLDLLESARAWDPYNEHLYRDIMRLQAKLGQPDAVRRTVELLTVRLAEIDSAPSAETRALAEGLQRRAAASASPTVPNPD